MVTLFISSATKLAKHLKLHESSRSGAKDGKYLFPISNISLKTISSIFAEEEKEELVVYKTNVEAEEIPNCDTYIFTSPSNVRGFLINNSIPNNAKVISWGESTTRELGASGIVVNHVLLNATIEELFEIL